MIKKIWKQLRSDWVRVLTALVMASLIYLMRSDFFNRNTVSRDIDNVPVTLDFQSSNIINLGSNIPKTTLTIQGNQDKISALTAEQIKIILPISQNDIGRGLIDLTPENIKTPAGVKVIRIHNPQITVHLEQVDSKKVPIEIVFDSLNKLSANYSVAKASPFPREVTISGPRSKIKDIKSVATRAIPLDSSVQNSFKYTAEISAPSGITTVPAKVACDIEIIQNFTTRIIKVPAALLIPPKKHLPLEFKVHPQQIELKFSGPSRIVHFLTQKDFYVFVNAENIATPGEYTQQVHCLSNNTAVRITSVNPSQVTVTVQKQ